MTPPSLHARRRGLAMPMVLLLVLVAGLLLTVALQREDASTRATVRRLDAYQHLHAQRGLQEIIEMWLRSYATESVAASLDDDGLAFELELADRSTVRVTLHEAQGSVRRELAGLGRTERNRAEGVLAELAKILGGPQRLDERELNGRALTRDAGPVAISVATASRSALIAAATYALRDQRRAETLVDALETEREGDLDPSAIETAARSVSADQTERVLLQRVLTTDPTLWWCRVELRGTEVGRPNAVSAAYGGYLQTGASEGARGSPDAPAARSRGSFLSWEPVDPDDRSRSPVGDPTRLQSRGGRGARPRVQ